ncbi:hypothetical protein DIS24_g11037 [Lasiodiplodia hormozganensis]|uniref:Uncharacterized protein n=1 Tax=Lasiodiplodia hormozganensis TaxID=869390 RepID=A0AA40C5Q0_9PEZI|nr:hypothetical protein DIS24_g11037 [Lasiodiplodia hormozganensis]
MVTTRRGAGKSATPGPSTPVPSHGPARRRSNNRRITIARSPSKTLSPSPAHAETPPSRRAARAATNDIRPGTYTEESTSSSSSDAASSSSPSSHASPAAASKSPSPPPSPAAPATRSRPRRGEKRKASSSSSPAATPEAAAAADAAPRRGERLRRASAIAASSASAAARGPQLGTTKRKIVSSAASRRRRRERDRLRRQQKRREREREEVEGQDSGEESPDENDPAVKAYRRIQANGEFINFWYPPFDGTLAPLDHAAQGETQEGDEGEGQDGGQDEGEGEQHQEQSEGEEYQLQRGATGVMEIEDSESEPEDLQHHEQAGEPMDVETGGEAVVETGGDVVMETTAGEVVAEQEGEEHGVVGEEELTVDYATTDILTGSIIGPGFLPQWSERVPADMGILRELEAHRARHAALNSGWPFPVTRL